MKIIDIYINKKLNLDRLSLANLTDKSGNPCIPLFFYFITNIQGK